MSVNTHAFIYFPWMCQVVEADINYNEKVCDLIKRLLSNVGIKEFTYFNLYAYSKDLKKIPQEENCSIFMNDYERFVIIPSEYSEVNVFYENRRGFIHFNPKTHASNLMTQSIYCFSLSSDACLYVFFDPDTNNLIPMDKPTTTKTFIIKSVSYEFPNIVIDLSSIATLKDQSNFLIFSLARTIFTLPMKKLLSMINSRRDQPFEMITFNNSQIDKCHQFLEGEIDLSNLTPPEQNSLMFMLLSANESNYISPSLHEFALKIMEEPNEITKLEMCQAFVAYLPLTSHIVYLELVQIFGGGMMFVQTYREVMCIITELFFRRIINREQEYKFITFIFVFYKAIVRFKSLGKDSEVRLFNNQLVLFEKNTSNSQNSSSNFAIRPEGFINIPYEQTTPLIMDNSFEQILEKYVVDQESKSDISSEFEEMNQKAQQIKTKIAAIQKIISDDKRMPSSYPIES